MAEQREENKMMNMNIPPQPSDTTTTTTTTNVGNIPVTTTATTSTSSTQPSCEVTGTSSLSPDDQDYWHYCWRHSYNQVESDVATHGDDKHKLEQQQHQHQHQKKWKYDKERRHQKKMDTLICNSCDMLKDYFDPNLYPNHQIPYDLFLACKAVIFLRIWKAGIFVGGIGGTGIVLAHRNEKWSNPCAISIGGLQLGLHLGVERVDDILLLRDESSLNFLFEKGHFKLGADASIAIGPYGRDANVGVAMSGKDSKSLYSYSFAKGGFIGLSLDGGNITVNDNVNEEFYGRKIPIRDILCNDTDIPQNEDLLKLKQLLNNYSSLNVINMNTNTNTQTNRPINKTTDVSVNPIVNQ